MQELRCLFSWQACKVLQVMFTLQSALCCVLIYFLCDISLFSLASTSHIYCKLEVYVCIYMCSNVLFCDVYSCLYLCEGVICMCVCVRVCCPRLILVLQSAVVLLLFSCCHRNTLVVKLLLLLPCYHISCSLFPQWLRTRPPSQLILHLLPLQAAGSSAAKLTQVDRDT